MLPGVERPAGRRPRRRRAASCEAFELPVDAGDELVSVHLSVGIAASRQSGGDGDELIRNADVAMYQAKSKGKARFELFEPPMAAAILRRHDLKEELAKAIEREQMIVQYQPIVALDTRPDRRRRGARALGASRCAASSPPAEFVPLAEETGLIVAARPPRAARGLPPGAPLAGRRDRSDVEPLRMHVNLSVAELRDPGLVDNVLRRRSRRPASTRRSS